MDKRKAWRRREILAMGLAMMTGGRVFAQEGEGERGRRPVAGTMTIKQVIDSLQADIPGAPFPKTVDTIKAGDPGQVVKGIVTTMFATDEVITRAAGLGANFIIAHEPTFYNHLDETDWLGNDEVLNYKRALLDKNGMVVWRFHDGLHAHKPDGVRFGVMQALGWEKYYDFDDPYLVEMPAMTIQEIITHVKDKLGIDKLKYIGDPVQTCRRIALLPGAAGGQKQIGTIQKYKPDLLICGELNEWETSEYVRDARYQGQKVSLLVLGHAVSEEPGMEALVPWLNARLTGVPVKHIPSGDAFGWV